jgi:hypothetical protein
LKFLVQLADRNDHTLDVLAVIQVLLRLLVAFFQLDFHGDHLHKVSQCETTCVSSRIYAYLHVGVGQPGIADDGRAAIDDL